MYEQKTKLACNQKLWQCSDASHRGCGVPHSFFRGGSSAPASATTSTHFSRDATHNITQLRQKHCTHGGRTRHCLSAQCTCAPLSHAAATDLWEADGATYCLLAKCGKTPDAPFTTREPVDRQQLVGYCRDCVTRHSNMDTAQQGVPDSVAAVAVHLAGQSLCPSVRW